MRIAAPHLHRLAALLVLALSLLPLAGCGGNPAAMSQGSGLPVLHRLDWGFPWIEDAIWSPDGQWIAMRAGSDSVVTHFQVVSRDGRTRYSLKSWGCGEIPDSQFGVRAAQLAWLPDNQLSCIKVDEQVSQMCIGSAPFATCSKIPVPPPLRLTAQDEGAGMAWTPDGQYVVVSARSLQPDGTFRGSATLGVISRDGKETDILPHPAEGGYYGPEWVPHTSALSYIHDADDGHFTKLLVVQASLSQDGQLRLGAMKTLVDSVYDNGTYAWSPTGNWVAFRHADYRSGDKIYLINSADPTKTVDVVSADKLGRQMTDPVWSPDGQTIIVFTVEVGRSEPYAIDIASYLKSKGLEV